MPDQTPTRKLTAILYADVVGYSRLTGKDELGTHQRVMGVLDQASAAITDGGGKVLRYAGDAILAEFPSVVGAVETAVGIQNSIAERNTNLDDGERVEIRIGVNLGEVLQDRDEIYGEGVNLAARLEAAAKPGGLCMSAAVHDQVGGKVDIVLADGGEQSFKNIDRPVRVYHWKPGTVSAHQAAEALPLPDRPSIAVLPFDNMSKDPDQEFFADGLAEDIITELSREEELFVTARHSTFAYKGLSTDIRQIARELGVQYVLEGSVRRAGDRLRLNAQLIEAEGNRHIWAERYDRQVADIFDIQDELTSTIYNTLLQKVRDTSMDSAMRRPTQNMAVYDLCARAFGLIYRLNQADNEKALQAVQQALALDPNFARAHWLEAWVYIYRVFAGWEDDHVPALEHAREAALKSVNCDPKDFWGYGTLGFAELFLHNNDRALTAIDQAIALNPNSADNRAIRALALNYLGRPEEALAEIQNAIRHNPHHPYYYLSAAGRALFMLERYDEALPYLERLVHATRHIPVWGALLAACYVALGRKEEGRDEVRKLLAKRPEMTLTEFKTIVPLRDERYWEQYAGMLRQAGLPD